MTEPAVNKVRCKRCDGVIESKHAHNFQRCKCGVIYIVVRKRYGWKSKMESIGRRKY